MIELKKVCKSYFSKNKKHSYQALYDIDAKFDKNEFVTILGPSSSGKTTLLNVISGFDKCDSGEIFIDGVSTASFKEHDWDSFRAHKIGFIFQDYNLVDHLSALDNVAMALAFNRTPIVEARERAKEALEMVGLTDHLDAYPEELSGGQKQCVCIARAIVKDPEIILADEPTGALDTESSELVMQALKSAGKERLVIMATHKVFLAEKHSTTQYNLADGKLSLVKKSPETQSDTSTSTPQTGLAKSYMALSHSLALSFSNFKKHRTRSSLIVLANAIGVIAITLVLSLSTGATNYIKNIEETSLASTPITISKYKWQTQTSTSSDSTQATTENEKASKRAQYLQEATNNRRIALNNTIATLLSSNGASAEESAKLINDVPSLKKYLDSNPDNVLESCASVEYTYDISPIIYLTANNTIEEVSPGGLFGSVGSGSSSQKGARASVTSASTLLSMLSDFRPLAESRSVYEDSSSLVEGCYPENSGECVLVINSDGTMDDTLAYTLGLKNFSEDISPLLEKYEKGEKVDFPGIYDSYSYSDIVGITFKVINPSDVYQKKSDGLWEDMSLDENYMKDLVNNKAQDLKIVGVVKPNEDSKSYAVLSEGIYYHPSLNTECMNASLNSAIVKEQLANPDVDVLSGKSFAWLKQASKITDRIDFSNIVNINADLLATCVTLHPEVLDFADEEYVEEEQKEVQKEITLTDKEMAKLLVKLFDDPEFQEFIKDLSQSPRFDASVEEVLAQSGTAYTQYCFQKIAEGEEPQTAEVYFSKEGEGYAWTVLAQSVIPEELSEDISKFVAKYATRISNYLTQTVETEVNAVVVDLQNSIMQELNSFDAALAAEDDGPSLIEFDEDKFAEAIKINITEDDVDQLGHYLIGNTSHTYASNLRDFGYASLDEPIACSIYPKSFSDKETITKVLDTYNSQNRAADNENKVIAYSDVLGTIAKVILSAVTIISGVLLAFVVVSLISAFIMMTIVFGIMTFQRSREIGILRALGACKRDILVVFNSENMIYGFAAGAFGCIVTAIICAGFNAAVYGSVKFDIAQLTPEIVIGILISTTLVSTLAGIVPSFIASRKDPAKSIK